MMTKCIEASIDGAHRTFLPEVDRPRLIRREEEKEEDGRSKGVTSTNCARFSSSCLVVVTISEFCTAWCLILSDFQHK